MSETPTEPPSTHVLLGEAKLTGSEFFGVEIGGYRLAARLLADGPAILGRRIGEPKSADRGVALGSCTELIDLSEIDPAVSRRGREHSGYWLCKYSASEPRLSLALLSDAEAEEVRSLFGIGRGDGRNNGAGFYHSPCWPALVRYVEKHPRKAKGLGRPSPYVGDWYEMARATMVEQSANSEAPSKPAAQPDKVVSLGVV